MGESSVWLQSSGMPCKNKSCVAGRNDGVVGGGVVVVVIAAAAAAARHPFAPPTPSRR